MSKNGPASVSVSLCVCVCVLLFKRIRSRFQGNNPGNHAAEGLKTGERKED